MVHQSIKQWGDDKQGIVVSGCEKRSIDCNGEERTEKMPRAQSEAWNWIAFLYLIFEPSW